MSYFKTVFRGKFADSLSRTAIYYYTGQYNKQRTEHSMKITGIQYFPNQNTRISKYPATVITLHIAHTFILSKSICCVPFKIRGRNFPVEISNFCVPGARRQTCKIHGTYHDKLVVFFANLDN